MNGAWTVKVTMFEMPRKIIDDWVPFFTTIFRLWFFFLLLLRSSTSQIMIFNSHFHRNDFVHFALFFFHFCYQFILSHIRAHTHRRSFLHSEVASDSFTHTNARTYAHYHTFKSINRVWKKNEVFSHWNDFPFISFSFSFGYIWILLTEANE